MRTDQVEVKFTCKKCGGTVLELPHHYTDTSTAKCKKCGVELGRWGDIKGTATKAAGRAYIEALKKTLSGIKGFKVKNR